MHKEFKRCSKCGEEKELAQFYNKPRAKDGKHPHCKVCHNKMTNKWVDDHREESNASALAYAKSPKGLATARARYNPEKQRTKLLRQKFNMTDAQYEIKLAEQNGVCAICQQAETMRNGRSGRLCKLAVDHNHKTGQVRRLLCRRCNTVIGMVDEDSALLEAAAVYLRQQSEIGSFHQNPLSCL